MTEDISGKGEYITVSVDSIPDTMSIVDIGPGTIDMYSSHLSTCKTIFWNGPMGIYEVPQFSRGTTALVELLAELDATTVIGGGSTADAVQDMGVADKMTHVSTGGGASLEFLEGSHLPGIEALLDKDNDRCQA
jgi:phosphoglycerate kinase